MPVGWYGYYLAVDETKPASPARRMTHCDGKKRGVTQSPKRARRKNRRKP